MPEWQSFQDSLLYVLRILIPLLSIYVLVRAFHSIKAGRRREEPVIVLQNTVTKETVPVLYWENSIGRSRSCDVVLSDPPASRDHAVLMRRESGWFVTDTDSKAGTRVNGRLIHQSAVSPGDVITLGSTSLMLKRTSEAKLPQQQRRVRHAASPFGLLVTVSVIQFFLLLQACFGGGEFSFLPVMPFLAIQVMEWGLYLYSMKGLDHVSFELETIAFLLAGTGIMLLSGMRGELGEGQEAPGMWAIVDSTMSNVYMQLLTMLMGIFLFVFLIWFMGDLDRVTKFRPWIGGTAILLFAVNLVFATAVHGAGNWIRIGPVSVQPSEFIKVAFVFVGAATLDRLQTKQNLTGFLVFTGVCLLSLFLMKDFGTACVFFVTFLFISFMRSGSIRTIVLAIAAAVFGAFLILKFRPYVLSRFQGWRHVWDYVNESQGYQQVRVLSYGASGGLFGMGIGNGKLGGGRSANPVFAADSDLVFGMLWEELGLVMAVVVVCAIAMLVLCARSDATRSRSTFYSIAACSAAGLLLFQACLNVFGVVDVLPLTGVTLPFVSAGGSSMVSVWGMLAFIKAGDERTYAARRRKQKRR